MAEEELWTKIAEALNEFEVFTAGDGHPSIRMKSPWTDKEMVSALMPVVCEALAEQWDDMCELRDPEKRENPWRENND